MFKKLSEKEKISWLRLIRSENIGAKTFIALLNLYGDADCALEAIPRMSIKGGKTKATKIYSKSEALREIELCTKLGARIIGFCEDNYPQKLRTIVDFPPVITVLGKGEFLHDKNIAVVGSRNASANGCRFAKKIAHDLGMSGYHVVSGLARGIDTAAHYGALNTGTIAVIATGIDVVYPLCNKSLYANIAEEGVIITEMPFSLPPKAQNFPRRNRIISGLSKGVLVVEASLRSGSLITANMALEQGREVMAVPGMPFDPRYNGTNSLIKQGAALVENVMDVLNVVESINIESAAFAERMEDKFIQPKLPVFDNSQMAEARKIIAQMLDMCPVDIDSVIEQTQIPAHIALNVIVEMELAGRVERHRGNKVSLTYIKEECL